MKKLIKSSLYIPGPLWDRLKRLAIKQKTTLTKLVIKGVKMVLGEEK
jgi:hypothetical protein